MRVHHLDCLAMHPFGGSFLGGEGGIANKVRLVAHCLLVERANGLALVDTGAAVMDAADPYARFGRAFISSANAKISKDDCALERVKALGFEPKDVRDIVLTHLDLDHAAGLVDFPWANVHVTRAEHAAASARATLVERLRYVPAMWSHDVKWRDHDASSGDTWNGFEVVRPIDDESDIALVPLSGHTRGHAAVAVRSAIPGGREWLFHAGDSYFAHDEIHGDPPLCPTGLAWYQAFLAPDDDARKRNQERLRRLARDASAKADVFCAHSAPEYERLVRIERDFADDRPTARDVTTPEA